MEPPSCKNIRSRRLPDQRCPNPAVHGEYCGIHFKHPIPFKSKARMSIDETDMNSIVVPIAPESHVRKIQRWWRLHGRIRMFIRQGPAKWLRGISTNDTDFYSMEDISGLSGENLFSFVENDKLVYAFDIRSIASLFEKHDISGNPINPYTRQVFSEKIIKKAKNYIRWCRKKNVDTRWAPIDAENPEQKFKLKVIDLFQKIDELSYYTNPDWFLSLSADNLRCFYVELHDIWFHRAELTQEMRYTIIPPPAYPFKYSIREIVAQKSIDFLRKVDMEMIRMFIEASPHRSDRVLGAMYIVTVLTLVNKKCRDTYPWLYESASPGIYSRYQIFTNPGANLLLGPFPPLPPLIALPTMPATLNITNNNNDIIPNIAHNNNDIAGNATATNATATNATATNAIDTNENEIANENEMADDIEESIEDDFDYIGTNLINNLLNNNGNQTVLNLNNLFLQGTGIPNNTFFWNNLDLPLHIYYPNPIVAPAPPPFPAPAPPPPFPAPNQNEFDNVD